MMGKYESQEKYDRKNAVAMMLKLNRKTDADILRRLEDVGNKQGYIKALIRADIKKKRRTTMKIKEYNRFKSRIYEIGMECEEIRNALQYNENVYVYDVSQINPPRHEVLVLTAKTQLNDNTLAAKGFLPESTDANLIIAFNRVTKSVKFRGES